MKISIGYTSVTVIITFLTLSLATLISYIIGYTIYVASSPQIYKDAEEALSIFGFGFIISLVLAPLSLLPSYLLSMKLAVYLREKRGWEIRHPRRLFALAVLMIFALPLLAWLL